MRAALLALLTASLAPLTAQSTTVALEPGSEVLALRASTPQRAALLTTDRDGRLILEHRLFSRKAARAARASLTTDALPLTGAIDAEGRAAALLDDGRLVVLDPEGGARTLPLELTAPEVALLVGADRGWVLADGRRWARVSLEGVEHWSESAGEEIVALAAGGGRVALGTASGEVRTVGPAGNATVRLGAAPERIRLKGEATWVQVRGGLVRLEGEERSFHPAAGLRDFAVGPGTGPVALNARDQVLRMADRARLAAPGVRRIVAGGAGGVYLVRAAPPRIEAWRDEDLSRARLPAGPADEIQALAWAADGRGLEVGTLDGEVWRLELATGRYTPRPALHAGAVVSLFATEEVVVSAARDGSIGLFRGEAGQRIPLGRRPAALVAGAEDTIVVNADDGRLHLLHPGPKPRLETLPGRHGSGGKALAAVAGGRRLASGAADGSVLIWERCDSGYKPVQRLKMRPEPGSSYVPHVHAVGFSPDGDRLWVAVLGGRLLAFEHEPLRLVHSQRVHASSMEDLAVHPDGRVVTAGADAAVKMVDGSGVLLAERRFEGAGTLTEVEWSPDGRRLAVGAADGRVRVLNGKTLEVLLVAPR